MSLRGHSINTYQGREQQVACTQGPGGSRASRGVPVPCFCCEQTSLWGDKHRWGDGEGLPSPRRRDLGSHSGSAGHHREEKEIPYTRTELPPRGQGPAWPKQTLLGPLPLRCGSLPVSGYSRHPTDSTKYHEQEQSILAEGRDTHWMSGGRVGSEFSPGDQSHGGLHTRTRSRSC